MQQNLHGRSILDEVNDEFMSDSLQALQNLNGSVIHVSLVVLDVPFLAEGLNEFVSLSQVVARDAREQVVVNLVLKTSAEPVDKELGKSVSTGNVTGGGDLQLPKVGSLVGVVGGHTVVSQAKDNGQVETTGGSDKKVKGSRVKEGEASETTGVGKHPDVVHGDEGLFGDGVLKTLELQFDSGVLRGGSQSERSLEGLVQPRETSQKKDGEVEDVLVLDHELDKG
mmetsp:Transcript_30223/g.72545  ORF Transcript_30223/g.72545 Transcript_30223/m.72545 type:complete len:225 (+) Transcript_30223:49-723(+)